MVRMSLELFRVSKDLRLKEGGIAVEIRSSWTFLSTRNSGNNDNIDNHDLSWIGRRDTPLC